VKPIVHGAPGSPFVTKVLALLREKGIDHECRWLVPVPKTPQLLAMNPLGKIPILEHGGLLVPDSSVICAYLERLQPEPRLFPADPAEYARALWYEEYADTALLEASAPIGFERTVKRVLGLGPPDEERVRDAIENRLPPVLDYLEAQLSARTGGGNGQTLLSELSIADLAVGGQLAALGRAEFAPDPSRWPRLSRYARDILRRPSFQYVEELSTQRSETR
jgi:glutathione S-transferase